MSAVTDTVLMHIERAALEHGVSLEDLDEHVAEALGVPVSAFFAYLRVCFAAERWQLRQEQAACREQAAAGPHRDPVPEATTRPPMAARSAWSLGVDVGPTVVGSTSGGSTSGGSTSGGSTGVERHVEPGGAR